MDLCDEHCVISGLRYDNAKEESILVMIIQRIISNFCIIGRSSDLYTQQHNNYEGHIKKFQYQSKWRMIQTITPYPLWDFCIFILSEIMSRVSIRGQIPGLEVLTSDSLDSIK